MRKVSIETLMLTIQQWGSRKQLEDQWEWKGKKGTKYSVSDAYCKIVGEGVGDEEEVFQILWKEKAITAAQTCVWSPLEINF